MPINFNGVEIGAILVSFVRDEILGKDSAKVRMCVLF
jgi:hypothetical protein